MDIREFFNNVVTTDSGWFCVAFDTLNKENWTEEFYRWPGQLDKIVTRVNSLRQGHNVYFSPFLFREKQALKKNVLPTRTIVADLDEANILTVPIKPTILVESSPERHQGYWVVKEQPDTLESLESLSRNLTYYIPRCDPSGWFLGKLLRVPGTFNYKYSDGPKDVRIVDATLIQSNIASFEAIPTAESKSIPDEIKDLDNWIANVESTTEQGPYALLELYRHKLPPRVVVYYDRSASDRSEALWALTTALFRAGASREHVYWIARNSANNKFSDLKYGGARELVKDILRAQAATNSTTADLRTKILQLRRLPGIAPEKRAYIAAQIISAMERIGSFVNCIEGSHWFVREDQGKPIHIGPRSESLEVLLDTLFGLNATEPESKYVVHSLITHCANTIPNGTVSSLTYYDTDTKTLLIHTGRKDVLRVTSDNISIVNDGTQGIIFPWSNTGEIITPKYTALPKPWHEMLFGDCLHNLVGMDRGQAMALLRIWVIVVLLRNSVVSRPILAVFGQPGAGKSTLFRRLYALLYGKGKSLGAVTTADDFDFACATDPLVVLDNVDTPERWLPDRLALAAAASDLTKRKLYTNGETVTVKRQALLGITAHNPQFGREDVNDRMILLTFERLSHFLPETEMLDVIIRNRAALWGAIVQDVQAVLSTPQPERDEIPQFRVNDFARIGYWIAKALGDQVVFAAAIDSLRTVQKTFTLEEDHMLTQALDKWIIRTGSAPEYKSPGQLWPLLEGLSGDPMLFKQRYKNAVNLGKKLWALHDALKSIYDIEWKLNASKGSREWKIMLKGAAAPRLQDIRAS